MKALSAGLCVMPIVVLGGCAINPGLPDERRVSISDVMMRVQCELKAAYTGNVAKHPWLTDWAAGYTLTLDRQDKVGVDVGGAVLNTLSGGVLTLNGKVGASETASETGIVSFGFYLRDLERVACSETQQHARGIYFSGSTGVEAWFMRVADGIDESSTDLVKTPTSFGHVIDFKVSGSGSITPSWTAVAGNASGMASLTRSDQYNLKLGFTAIPAPPSNKPIRVEVVNFPSWLKSATPQAFGTPPVPQPKGPPPPKAKAQSDQPPARRTLRSLDVDTQRQIDRVLERLERFELRTR